MNRIEKKFKELKARKKKAFIAFLTAGFPDLAVTEKLILKLAESGADIIELGIPFSDPVADGAVIQEASQWALERNKVNLGDVLKLVKKVRARTGIPFLFMTYYNPVFVFGEEKLLRRAKACGVDGLIIPDLPFEEGKRLAALSREYGIDVINFIAPTTGSARMRSIVRSARGFIYYISLTGTTGARKSLASGLSAEVKKVRSVSPVPVCCGFGISDSAQVKRVSGFSDGVIVGSAIVRKVRENIGKKDLVNKVGSFVKRLAAAV